MNNSSIRTNPVITKLLDKVPADMRSSFTDEQLLALKVALGLSLYTHLTLPTIYSV